MAEYDRGNITPRKTDSGRGGLSNPIALGILKVNKKRNEIEQMIENTPYSDELNLQVFIEYMKKEEKMDEYYKKCLENIKEKLNSEDKKIIDEILDKGQDSSSGCRKKIRRWMMRGLETNKEKQKMMDTVVRRLQAM